MKNTVVGARLRTLGLLLVVAVLGIGVAEARRHHDSRPADNAPGRFDYYLLSLSWSPAYCVLHPGDGAQCNGQGFGFVLHGLWPQFDAGGYPQSCGGGISPEALALGNRIYPSPALVRHEWERHGSCSGLSPTEYFQTADRALAVVKTPAIFETPRADRLLTVRQIRAAFQDANPALPMNAISVNCGRAELSEVRVCLTRDLRPRACGRDVRDSCPSRAVRVRAAR